VLGAKLPGGSADAGANVTKAVEAEIAAAADKIGAAPEIKHESAKAVYAECDQPGGKELIENYSALRRAATSGNPSTTGNAAFLLSRGIDANPSNQKCWAGIRKELSLNTAFERNLEGTAQLSFALKRMQ
jgi:hypothetical protein